MKTAKHPVKRPDPLIDEIRAIRKAIWKEDDHNLQRHAKRIKEIERQYAHCIVQSPKKTEISR